MSRQWDCGPTHKAVTVCETRTTSLTSLIQYKQLSAMSSEKRLSLPFLSRKWFVFRWKTSHKTRCRIQETFFITVLHWRCHNQPSKVLCNLPAPGVIYHVTAVKWSPYFIIMQSVFLQYNLNGSNTDGSFTVDDSNSFFSPYRILPIAQENKYLGTFSYFIMELYVVCTH